MSRITGSIPPPISQFTPEGRLYGRKLSVASYKVVARSYLFELMLCKLREASPVQWIAIAQSFTALKVPIMLLGESPFVEHELRCG